MFDLSIVSETAQGKGKIMSMNISSGGSLPPKVTTTTTQNTDGTKTVNTYDSSKNLLETKYLNLQGQLTCDAFFKSGQKSEVISYDSSGKESKDAKYQNGALSELDYFTNGKETAANFYDSTGKTTEQDVFKYNSAGQTEVDKYNAQGQRTGVAFFDAATGKETEAATFDPATGKL